MLPILILLVTLSGTTAVSPPRSVSAQGSGCTPAGPEIPDNGVDEDCDGWLATSNGYDVRATHPRVLLTPDMLQATIERIYGSQAREPYSTWFNTVKEREDQEQDVDLVNLALIYKATGDSTYLNRFLARRPTTGDPGSTELYAIDILWDELPDEDKLNIMQRVSANDNCWYYNSIAQSQREPEEVSWGYHSAYGVERGLAYAGAFAYDDILQSAEVVNNPETYNRFNTSNYIYIVDKELGPEGYFHRIENRIAGNPSYNDALQGDYGGMYDNIGYDSSEEAHSVFVLSEFLMLTGEDRYSDMPHDKYRATFYQNMQYPHIYSYAETDRWCRRAGTETHEEARIWFTQTGSWQPYHDAVALTANLYHDPRMQYYFSEGRQRVLCGYAYDGMWWDLIFYDDTLEIEPPSTNQTATYFNGPGLVSMREDWSNDALFTVFVAGEGISRRYEDANSFLLHRKTDIIPHAGARIRFNDDNSKHAWYNIRSLGRNTLKIFDPEESFDINDDGSVGPLHSGQRLVNSDNFGGQLFETPISAYEGCFDSGGCGSGIGRYNCSAYPLNVCEVANVVRYEHLPGRYTYTVGDGAAAYTRKIDYFEREFLYLRPDIVVIFDRVKSVDPTFRKVWTIHTVPPPLGSVTPITTGHGMRQYEDESHVVIEHPETVAYLDILLPQQNKVTIRGGDTLLTSGQPLRSGHPLTAEHILESDIPRWLELFAIGSDVEGTATIHGDAEEGNGVTEDIAFDGTVQTYVTSSPTSMTTTTLQDTTQRWLADEWAGYVLRLRGGSSGDVLITGNDENTLSIAGGYDPSGVWGYYVLRPLANSYLHWKRIESITTSNMDVDNFIVSIPHYFDAVNAAGELHSFSPHTDSKDDGYRKRKDIGQWTVEVEATEPQLLDNFLHVFHLTDPGHSKVATQLVEGSGVSGALVADWFVLFSNTPDDIISATVTLSDTNVTALLLDLIPETNYYYQLDGQRFSIGTEDNGGIHVRSSDQGTVMIDGFSELVLHGAPQDQAIRLAWQVGATLPPTSTWQITYDPPDGDQPSPINGIISPTRAYTLTGLTNYTWYTVTLNGMLALSLPNGLDSTPFLTDTVRVMPTDIFVYLPLVLKGS